MVRIRTDEGTEGFWETYYGPEAVASLIHDWMATLLLGADALVIESHWRVSMSVLRKLFTERFVYRRSEIAHGGGQQIVRHPKSLMRRDGINSMVA